MSTNYNNYLNKQQNKNQELNQTEGNFGSISAKTSKIPQISSNNSESIPLITLPGATKRKSSEGISMKNNLTDFVFVDDDNYGPKPKQKRYEDKMSAKLDNIHLEDNGKQKQTGNHKKRKSTLSSSLEQISQPKIVEIVDWDAELLDEENSLPIIEEPKEEKNVEMKEQIKEKVGDHYNFEEADDEDLENEDENQKIVLTEKLRQLIYEGNERDFALLLKPKSKIIGNELILFVQPSISSLLFNSSKPQIEEIKIEENNGKNNINEMNEEENSFLDLQSTFQVKENYLKEGKEDFEEMDIG